MMRRVFWTSAALAALVQLPRLLEPWARISLELMVLPVVAILLYLVAVGFATTEAPAPPALVIATMAGGSAAALVAAPFRMRPPTLELAAFLAGAVGLIAAVAWISVQHRLESSWSSILVALGGTTGVVVFCRATLRSYLASFRTEASGLATLVYDAMEITAGFGLGGALLLAAGFLYRRGPRHVRRQ